MTFVVVKYFFQVGVTLIKECKKLLENYSNLYLDSLKRLKNE